MFSIQSGQSVQDLFSRQSDQVLFLGQSDQVFSSGQSDQVTPIRFFQDGQPTPDQEVVRKTASYRIKGGIENGSYRI